MNIMIAAAGTAGHINPALSIANKLKKEYILDDFQLLKWQSF